MSSPWEGYVVVIPSSSRRLRTQNEGTMGTPTYLHHQHTIEATPEQHGFIDCRGEWQDLDPAMEIEPC